MNLTAVLADVRNGFLPAHIYNDPDIYQLERDRLFGNSWVFVAHASEIPNPGDYVVRKVLDDSFIIVRGDDGTVRALFNMCIHRGMQVCRAEAGTTARFRCPYHAWIYANDGHLIGLPFHQDAYGGNDGFDLPGAGLITAPAFDSYNGMLFVSLNPTPVPLLDFLGEFRFYLDLYTLQSPAGLELRGPQRWRINANWKIGAENFAGDSYHTPQTHASVVDIRLFGEPIPNKRKEGVLYHAGPGGGTTYKLPPESGFEGGLRYVGYPDAMIDRMATTWTPQQQQLVGHSGFMVSAATLFPNLSFVHNWPHVDDDGTIAPFISLRVWQPISECETEVLSWFAVAADAPDDFKERSYKAYLLCFGSSGMFEQDDVENWVSITKMAKGRLARQLRLNNRMGLRADGEPVSAQYANWTGPGTAYQGFSEHNQRNWLNFWCDALEREPT